MGNKFRVAYTAIEDETPELEKYTAIKLPAGGVVSSHTINYLELLLLACSGILRFVAEAE